MIIHIFAKAILVGLAVTVTSIATIGVDTVAARTSQLVTPQDLGHSQDQDDSQDIDGAIDADDHETARDAHRESQLVPYGRIQSAVQEQFSGRVVYQSLSPSKDGGWIYELKVLKDDGHVLMVFVDASSGEVLRTKGKN